MIKHQVKHYYQPTNRSCSQAALAILLSFYGSNITPEVLLEEVPVAYRDDGSEWGTINQHLATWCTEQGFTVDLYTADFQVIDLSWARLSRDDLLARMKKAQNLRNVPGLGKESSEEYMESYASFVKAGGNLHIDPYIGAELLDNLLQEGPLLLCVCPAVLYNTGRSKHVGLRKSVSDDLRGKISNHSIVLYGIDDNGDYLFSDPWEGDQKVTPEQLVCAIQAAQIECDNLLFQIKKNKATDEAV